MHASDTSRHKWIRENKAPKKSTGLVLFDIEKAFDSLWHDGLIFKLSKFSFPLYFCKIINAFCRERSFTVHVGDSRSRSVRISTGLAQGSALSALLYCIFVADSKLPKKIQTACYAICGDLQNALSRIDEYIKRCKIKISANKTQAIVFPFNRQTKR